MSTSPGVVTAVRWTELCPWLLLVRAARAALLARVIALATVGVLVTQWGWWAIEGALLPAEGVAPLARLTDHPAAPLLAGSPAPVTMQPFDAVDQLGWSGPLIRGWAWAIQPLARLAEANSFWAGVAFVAAGAWAMAVWALFGGAISRIAALYLARGELLGPIAALKSAAMSWVSTIAAPSFCLGVIALFTALLIAVGFVIRLGLLAFLAGLLWVPVLLLGVALAVFAIGLVVGWPLMWATIATERTDAFDGVSRGYAFTYQRPLHLVFFVIVATVLGLLAQTAVSLVVGAAFRATHFGVAAGAGQDYANALLRGVPLPEDEELGSLAAAGGAMMRFWSGGLWAIAAAFPMAYLFPAATGIYLLLRRLIDSTELSEVALDEGEPERGLPPLVTDPVTGVPKVQAGPPVDGAASTEKSATVTELRGGST
jgi:hypothetical protein